TIDKVAKIGVPAVLKEIEDNFGVEAKDKVAQYLSIDGDQDFDRILELINNDKAKVGVENLRLIFNALAPLNLTDVRFNHSIARGLNYYTSTIFETLVSDLPTLGSVCSGGRYDNLIGQLGGPDCPAVGSSIGLDRLMEAISQLNMGGDTHTKTEVYIVNLDESLDPERLALAQSLRAAGIPTEIYYSPAKLGKQLESIDKLGVSKVIIYGQDEHAKNIVIIKDLNTSGQQEVAVSNLVEELKKDR
ncbi:MAG TPA: HisS family protein, partial [Candidatus Saccharimonadales bacterium]